MKYKPQIYAKAFLEVLNEKRISEKDAVERFLVLIKKNGDGPNLQKIVDAIEVLKAKNEGSKIVHLEFARPAPEALIKEIKNKFAKEDRIKISSNPRLIAGTRIIIDGEMEFDYSLERKLRKLFTT